MGMIPSAGISPTVGLIPTIPQTDEGETIDPWVSVPTARTHIPADTAAADPELDPDGVRSRAYGFFVSPPRPLQPLVERVARKLAHSLMFVLPRRRAPAWRSFRATEESRGATDPSRASEPAVVVMRSWVAMLSLRSTEMPRRGPRAGSRSSARAISRASG